MGKSGNYRLIIVLMLAFLMVPTGLFGGGAREAGEAQTIVLRVGHGNTTDSVYGRAFRKLVEELDARTGGRIVLEEYPGGVLGNETTSLDLYATGDIDMNFALSSNAVPVVSELGMLDSLFLFEGEEHFRRFATSRRTYEIIQKYIDARNLPFSVGAISLSGARSIYSVRRPIRSMADMRGFQIRVPPSPVAGQMWEAVGASPVTLPWPDIYSGLETGVVDGAENDPSWYFDGRHIEVAKHFTRTEHQFAPAILFVGKQTLEKIPADLRQDFDDALEAMAIWWLDYAFSAGTALLDEIPNRGATLYEVDQTFAEDLRRAVSPLIQNVVNSTGTQELYDHIRSLR